MMDDIYARFIALGYAPEDFVLQDDGNGNGPYIRHWTAEGKPPTMKELEAVVIEPPVPETISRRQFAQILAMGGIVSQAEALAWAARGDLPEAMQTAVAALPEEQQFPALMLLSSATEYQRAHPMVGVLGQMLGYDDAALDDIWLSASSL